MRIRKLAAFFSLICLLAGVPAGAAEKEVGPQIPATDELQVSQRNYSSLPGLIAMLGQETMAQLQDFFLAEPVFVEPFIVLNEFSTRAKISLFGATLAEHLAAVVGNESLSVWRPAERATHQQSLSGVLQEIDGYLRVHALAVNARGESRSCVVNVQMTEPIYRALHRYVSRR